MTRGLFPAIVVAVLVLAAGAGRSAAPAAAHGCANGSEHSFRAADGTRLVGHRFGGAKPGKRTAVVLAHMSVGDLCQWAPYARALARQGLFAFPFDFRGHGLSGGRENHARAAADVVAAVRAVRKLGARKVVVVGASLGGIAALVAAPTIRPALAGVVSVSGPAAIEGAAERAARQRPRIRVPTLYLVAQDDQNPPYDFAADAQTLYDATGTAEKRLEVAPGALHGTFLVSGSPAIRKLLLAFLRAPAATVP